MSRCGRIIHAITTGHSFQERLSELSGWDESGSRVAEMLECLGCHIIFYDPLLVRQTPSSWKRIDSIENLVKCSAIVCIHSAPQPDGSSLIRMRMCFHTPMESLLINTARGTLIDEQSLISALISGKVKAAALDVFPSEPYNGELLSFSQVIVTPHVASNTVESRHQMEMESVNNLI